jgi:hypothetical protein
VNKPQIALTEEQKNNARKTLLVEVCDLAGIDMRHAFQVGHVQKMIEYVPLSMIDELMTCFDNVKTSANGKYLNKTPLISMVMQSFRTVVESKLNGTSKQLQQDFIKHCYNFKPVFDDHCRANSRDVKNSFPELSFGRLTYEDAISGEKARYFSDFDIRIIEKIGREDLYILLWVAPSGSELEKEVESAVESLLLDDGKDTPEGRFLLNYKPVKIQEEPGEQSGDFAIEDKSVAGLLGAAARESRK